MDNVVDALKMAAAFLIFVIAIATSFSVFGTAKKTSDSIIGMRDKQAYLEAAELEGVLYSTSDSVKSDGTRFTNKGDRIVSASDVISTIYRYSKEKYGVTIIESTGKVLARFSTVTESYIANYNGYTSDWWQEYTEIIKNNIITDYVKNPDFGDGVQELYEVTGGMALYDAKWLGNEKDIEERINADIEGGCFDKNGIIYQGKNLASILEGKKIVEVTNEIDKSVYLKEDLDGDGIPDNTDLVQQFEIPTVEIIYIVYEN